MLPEAKGQMWIRDGLDVTSGPGKLPIGNLVWEEKRTSRASPGGLISISSSII